ncbi:MAG: hypothetical protein IT249_11740 [Chitinophagaceae bacterium]|nr:hypothetical protein [Chitinophagaceae bacterium]
MKKSPFPGKQLFIVLFITFSVYAICAAQTSTNHTITNLDPNQQAFNSSEGVFSLTGTRVGNNKPPIENDALLYTDWMKGIVNFKNGKQFKDAQLKFNLVKNELYFNNNNKPNLFADAVSSFYIIDSVGGVARIAFFKNGYPALGEKNEQTFYLVMTAGPVVELLRLISKKSRETYEYGSSGKAVYEITEELLLYDVKANTLKFVKNNAASLSKAMPAYATVIQEALKTRSKHLSDEEMIEAVRQINNTIK